MRGMIILNLKKFCLFFLVAAIGSALPISSYAQSSRMVTDSSLNKRLKKIEKQLKAVQRKVFKPGSKFQGQKEAPISGSAVTGGNVRFADMETRIAQLETQLRQLTGRIEESNYQADQLKQKMDRLARDYEFRLAELEKAGPRSGTTEKPAAPSGVTPKSTGADILPAGSEKQQYSYAQKLVTKGQYAKAEKALSVFLKRYPKGALAGNAQYWIGQTYYVRKMYTKATRAFLEGYNNYPKSPKAAAFLLKIGMSLNAMGEKTDACDAYRELASRFPASLESKNKRPPEEKRAGCR